MANNSSIGYAFGFGAAAVSTVFFGSNFVPVKKVEVGDGLFFQFIVCNAILLVGIIVNVIRNFPRFYPFVMVGGAMWATGNLCVVPIIKTIGLGLGILIWATFSMVCGWASSRFGLFGLTKDELDHGTLNYIGVALCACSGILYMFVKTTVSDSTPSNEDRGDIINEPLFSAENDLLVPNSNVRQREDNIFGRFTSLQKRLIGCFLSIFSGLMYGFNFVPYLKVSQTYKDASQNALDYVFAQFVGTYVVSLLAFLIYAVVRKNNPRLYPRALLPAMACGLMWSVADVSWFIANESLGETISFPIITTSPPVIANLWTILLFKEVKGSRNFAIIGFAFLATCVGVVLIVLSKL